MLPHTLETDLALRKGYVVYLPVYQEGSASLQKDEPDVAERRRALRGFVVGTFRTEELFAHTFGRTFHPAIDFEVYDGEECVIELATLRQQWREERWGRRGMRLSSPR